ncbi:GrpB family protein [Vibrio nigripulchritudo]|uniref:GrpB family protein n=1 Tax=Vibrio nigripulchritudo TaxID=28173 RepID=UPI0005FA3B4E|nr:GrpB family protein [Vibrio nigripulchritudo]KJY68095.1 hypothetical protein TW74_25870 [Vibrio nigripulchritudo]
MTLGLAHSEVVLADYDSGWKKEFERVKQELVAQTKVHTSRIQHIGSTAIERLCAKPIIDIALGIGGFSDLNPELELQLKAIGFLRLKVEMSDRVVFAKFTDDSYQIKTHYLHVMPFESELWHDLMYFRNQLINSAELRSAYSKLKSQAASTNRHIDDYTDTKTEFVASVCQQRKQQCIR